MYMKNLYTLTCAGENVCISVGSFDFSSNKFTTDHMRFAECHCKFWNIPFPVSPNFCVILETLLPSF